MTHGFLESGRGDGADIVDTPWTKQTIAAFLRTLIGCLVGESSLLPLSPCLSLTDFSRDRCFSLWSHVILLHYVRPPRPVSLLDETRIHLCIRYSTRIQVRRPPSLCLRWLILLLAALF